MNFDNFFTDDSEEIESFSLDLEELGVIAVGPIILVSGVPKIIFYKEGVDYSDVVIRQLLWGNVNGKQGKAPKELQEGEFFFNKIEDREIFLAISKLTGISVLKTIKFFSEYTDCQALLVARQRKIFTFEAPCDEEDGCPCFLDGSDESERWSLTLPPDNIIMIPELAVEIMNRSAICGIIKYREIEEREEDTSIQAQAKAFFSNEGDKEEYAIAFLSEGYPLTENGDDYSKAIAYLINEDYDENFLIGRVNLTAERLPKLLKRDNANDNEENSDREINEIKYITELSRGIQYVANVTLEHQIKACAIVMGCTIQEAITALLKVTDPIFSQDLARRVKNIK